MAKPIVAPSGQSASAHSITKPSSFGVALTTTQVSYAMTTPLMEEPAAVIINPDASAQCLLVNAKARMNMILASMAAWTVPADRTSVDIDDILFSHGHLLEEASKLLDAAYIKLSKEASHG